MTHTNKFLLIIIISVFIFSCTENITNKEMKSVKAQTNKNIQSITTNNMVVSTVDSVSIPFPYKKYLYNIDTLLYNKFIDDWSCIYRALIHKDKEVMNKFLSDSISIRGWSDYDSIYFFDKENFFSLYEAYLEDKLGANQKEDNIYNHFYKGNALTMHGNFARLKNFSFRYEKNTWKIFFLYSDTIPSNLISPPSFGVE